MNKSFHNIEYRPLLPTHNYRVGYDADGYSWRIRKTANGGWCVSTNRPYDTVGFTCRTLADVSAQLERIGSSSP